MTSTPVQPAARSQTALLWTLAATQFLLILDTAILNVAVPHVAAGVGLGAAAQTWVINAFVVPFAGLLLPAGHVADRIGHRRVLCGGLLLVACGAALGAVAGSAALVITSRAVQGVGGAMAGAAALSLVFASFEDAARARALALFATMAGLGGVGGTLLGGPATQWLGWRSLFVLNVLGATALLLVAVRTVPRRDPSRAGAAPGGAVRDAIPLTIALGAAAYAVTSLADHPLSSPHVAIAGVTAVLAAGVFVLRESRTPTPVIPRDVWHDRGARRPLVLAALSQLALTPLFLLVSVYVQDVLGYQPATAGLTLLPMSVLVVAIAPQLPRVLSAVGTAQLAAIAFLLVAGAAAWLAALDAQSRFVTGVLGPTLLVALGLPALAMTTSLAASRSAGPGRAGLSAGLLTTAQQFGASIGLAALPAIATRSYPGAFLAAATVALVGAVLSALWLDRPARDR